MYVHISRVKSSFMPSQKAILLDFILLKVVSSEN